MRMVDLIEKKRNGMELSDKEISYIIQGYTNGDIPDYQMSAFAMAVYFQNMSEDERAALTMAMVKSGDEINLSAINGIKVDKHSTGGVGDTTTLVLAPLVASVGVPVAKMSGRGLGHTGGTIDKLEAVKGFSVEITNEQFVNLVNKNKIAVVGQSGNLTPADKKLYALRDVTATVSSIPLIASSIMSKKIASGADAIVLDVKTGAGAFMKELRQSEELAKAMVDIGNNLGRKTIAIISDMSQPLGYTIGNALEVKEAIETLKGVGPKDLLELCLTLGSYMVVFAEKARHIREARSMLEAAISSGEALEKFRTFLVAQGGDGKVIDDDNYLPKAQFQIEIKGQESGYVSEMVADKIGIAAMKLGAGRATKESAIDLAVGIELRKKVGDYVQKGDVLAILHSNQENVAEVISNVYNAYSFSKEQVQLPTLIYKEIR